MEQVGLRTLRGIDDILHVVYFFLDLFSLFFSCLWHFKILIIFFSVGSRDHSLQGS